MSGGKVYEVTFVDSGKTVEWTERKCIATFGRDEWKEIKAGYLPHIIVCDVSERQF